MDLVIVFISRVPIKVYGRRFMVYPCWCKFKDISLNQVDHGRIFHAHQHLKGLSSGNYFADMVMSKIV